MRKSPTAAARGRKATNTSLTSYTVPTPRIGTLGSMGSPLDEEVQSTGMIQPGAHPQFSLPTPLENAGDFFGKVSERALKVVRGVASKLTGR